MHLAKACLRDSPPAEKLWRYLGTMCKYKRNEQEREFEKQLKKKKK